MHFNVGVSRVFERCQVMSAQKNVSPVWDSSECLLQVAGVRVHFTEVLRALSIYTDCCAC